MKVDTPHLLPPRIENARAPSRTEPLPTSSPTSATFDLRRGVTKDFLQSALTTEIGKQIEGVLGKHGLSLTDAAGLDWSAEATSDRIVAGTTALLGVFARQHPELSDEVLLARFEDMIRGGIDRGYQQALSILEAVSTFTPEVRELGQRTIAMTHDKLTSWLAEQRKNLQSGKAGPDPAEEAPPWPPLGEDLAPRSVA
jgi:hypothetical protein